MSRIRHAIPQGALLQLALAAGLAVAGPACSAPTLPLPPPVVAEVTAPDPLTGLVRVSGEALDGSYVSCLNEDSAAGVIVQADDRGRYSLDIAAEVGDSLSIWQHLGTERGPYQHVQVPAPR